MLEQTIQQLKRDIRALERAELLGEKKEVKIIANKIVAAAKAIAGDSGSVKPADGESNNQRSELKHQTLGKHTFLYKPVLVCNPLEGDYLIKFSEQRTQELKRAGALDTHNSFWIKNEVIGGNIYGSIPIDILDEASVRKLNAAGWDQVSTELKNYGAEAKASDVMKQLKHDNQNFLLIHEQKSGAVMAIIFKI